ncbi:MAG: TPM domain-containing protein [Bacteroides sp.]|nr:TPM domain-containing protein [Bacteroides sp.]MCM1550693.1 TPM domain-containing protein [Clostridium sp.]
MKKFTRFLLILCAVIAVMALLPFAYSQAALGLRAAQVGERNKNDCTTTQRVFDYADVLTDKQEKRLQQLIDKRQKQLGLDIVIVTIDENVGSNPYNSSDNNTIYFAENFYEYFKFGYDGHYSALGAEHTTTEHPTAGNSRGAGVIYVDNWYDLNGYAESAFLAYRSASGNDSVHDHAYEIYLNQDRLSELEEDVWEYSNVNPYLSYRRMIAHLTADMVGLNLLEFHIKDSIVFLLADIVTIIFLLVNLRKKLGKKTTNMSTYVQGGQADITAKRDVFLSKHTTQRHIDTSSGGGGGHSSGGGGGGHSGGGGRH